MGVAHNVLYNVHGGLCLHNGGTFQIAFDNFRFEHNSYYSNTPAYRFLDCVTGLTPSMVIMRDNVFHSNVRIASSGDFTHSNNLYHMTGGATVGYALGAGEKTGDPRFIDVGAENLRLQAGSPAVDAAANLNYETDFDDAPRVVGAAPDMGAFELGATAETPAEPAPGPSPAPATSLNDSSVGTAPGQFSYGGSWKSSTGTAKFRGDDHYSSKRGNTYTVRFSGTRATLYAATAPWHGKAGLSVDGGPETTIDLYASEKADQVALFTTPVLAAGSHTLRVRVLGTRNVASSGNYVTADRVDVTP
jgi:hypothetical protein